MSVTGYSGELSAAESMSGPQSLTTERFGAAEFAARR